MPLSQEFLLKVTEIFEARIKIAVAYSGLRRMTECYMLLTLNLVLKFLLTFRARWPIAWLKYLYSEDQYKLGLTVVTLLTGRKKSHPELYGLMSMARHLVRM